jgi:proteasome lid subunit RPN8/RPN11
VRYLPLTNRAATADHFELDPVEVARAEARLRAVGLRIGGVFHSHPDAGPSPSTRDLEGAWPELVQLILGQEQPGGDAVFAAWRYHQGVATMLLLD